MRNQNILWHKVAANFDTTETQEEVDYLWSMMDKYCYGKEDCEELDRLAEKARQRILVVTNV